MSKIVQFLELAPTATTNKAGEVFTVDGFQCPSCHGRGFHNKSGYSSKFKKNMDDPDFPECKQCNGTGQLQAKVVIGWIAPPLPSKYPQEEE